MSEPSFIDDMAALQDELAGIEIELGTRRYDVTLRATTYTGANAFSGDKGTAAHVDTLMQPRPSVSLKGVFRTVAGEVQSIGDAEVRAISRVNYTRKALESVDTWIIDGEEYSLVQGGLKEDLLEFRAILKRRLKDG